MTSHRISLVLLSSRKLSEGAGGFLRIISTGLAPGTSMAEGGRA